MVRLHRFYFFFWKIYMSFKGIRKGVFCWEYSEQKGRYIKGVITSLSGCSVTNTSFGFDININWLAPLSGNDSRYYTSGSYSYKDYKSKLNKHKIIKSTKDGILFFKEIDNPKKPNEALIEAAKRYTIKLN